MGVTYSDSPRAVRRQEEQDIKTVNVELSEQLINLHFIQFCKGVLWPLFHYYGNGVKNYSPEAWKGKEAHHVTTLLGYCDVNQEFARVIASVYQEGDIIFIQDYHLLVLPQCLRERIPTAKIGLFIHTPWPRYMQNPQLT